MVTLMATATVARRVTALGVPLVYMLLVLQAKACLLTKYPFDTTTTTTYVRPPQNPSTPTSCLPPPNTWHTRQPGKAHTVHAQHTR